MCLRDQADTEIGGFGISSPGDLLRVTEVVLVPQVCTPVTVCLEDIAVADYFE